ncbi:MAG: G8 domain-containing protein [Actinomycetota bacterium]
MPSQPGLRCSWALGLMVLAHVLVACSGEATGPRDLTADQERVAATVASYGHLLNPHSSPQLFDEHESLLGLALDRDVSSVAVKDGDWSDPTTWFGGDVPARDAQVLIPPDVVVTIAERIEAEYGWVRVDGSLRFSPTDDTRLAATTLIVSEGGRLEIGTEQAPIAPSAAAHIDILPRAAAARDADTFDLGGGLLVHGDLEINGAERTPYAVPSSPLRAGPASVMFEEAPVGWAVGDRLLFADPNWGTVNDEIRLIAELRDDGREVVLEEPLAFDHVALAEIGSVPVANLTRNVVVASMTTEQVADRGHAMIMHRHEAVRIAYAAFENLGRTDTTEVHTVPTVGPAGALIEGTDANTIGRYGLHFHMRTGARASNAPHVVHGSVISGSPKHGLVNHGGHLVATGNIGYDNDGAHFFTENGTELGAFRNNLAVRSAGSGALIRDRDAAQDFGHQGHGFWMTSAAVELSGNWAAGHAGMGIVLFGYPLYEQGSYLYFPEGNLDAGDSQPGKDVVSISDVSFRYVDNTVLSSLAGLEIWVHKLDSTSGARSAVDGLRVADVAYQGINVFYARDIDLLNLQLEQGTEYPTGIGIGTNTMAENIFVDQAEIDGFAIGYVAPTRGLNAIHRTSFGDVIGVQVAPPTKAGRYLEFSEVAFGADTEQTIEMLDLRVPVNGDLSLLLGDDRLLWLSDDALRLYFPSQHADTIPFDRSVSSEFGGMTTSEMFDRFGISVGGVVIPSDAASFPDSNAYSSVVELDGLVTAPAAGATSSTAELTAAQQYTAKFRLQYPGAWENFRLADEVGIAADGSWQIGQHGSAVFADDEAPYFILRPSLSDLRIHPDDVAFGYRVDGQVYDRVGEFISVRAFTQDFHDLQVVDGQVSVDFTIHDMAGNELPVRLDLEVTTTARRRLGNLSFFNELETGLSEVEDMNAMALEYFGGDYRLTSAQG